jgi:hypothetical protein
VLVFLSSGSARLRWRFEGALKKDGTGLRVRNKWEKILFQDQILLFIAVGRAENKSVNFFFLCSL